ncbi:hypothetical protein Barb7_02622 [Bacteroidales bacterium Barb7]|nr:hypothetical protein Barb7_02622 [Bacteroidales bacterium Barb7]
MLCLQSQHIADAQASSQTDPAGETVSRLQNQQDTIHDIRFNGFTTHFFHLFPIRYIDNSLKLLSCYKHLF